MEDYHFHDAALPEGFYLILGHVRSPLTVKTLDRLKQFLRNNEKMSPPPTIDVEALRFVLFRGNRFDYQILAPTGCEGRMRLKENPIEQDPILGTAGTSLWNLSQYGVLATSKWLAHAECVASIRSRDFWGMKPVMAHIAPTLLC